ncbi:transcriptional regulator [Streptomyces avidinii]|uniref:DNA-binding CsgD family transcriptional regulator n=2 Tax=Streptomyces avidinii TaxID=1895 RepID=A0ABS4L5J1_STRAV|nr:DNA-binding CsgD family transcriptional regulator [Streptomyces avidinii]GGZ34868.1 transcriptional regulator [Streptomyces avidinii]
MDLLADVLAGVQRREGGVVLIGGGPGVGKTALLDVFLRRAADAGAQVFSASGSVSASGVDLAVIKELFLGSDDEEEIRAATRSSKGAAEFEDRLFAAMCRETRSQLVVVAVDDVQLADAASLRCLLYLVRRLRTAPLMMVLCESTGPQMLPPAFHAELLRHPQARQLRLLPLSRDGIAGVIEHHVDTVEAPDLVADFHAVSGGNPLLVHALLADSRDARRLDPQQPSKAVASTAFTKAALAWAYRDEAELFDVAAGVAVLGESATPSLVACLVGRGADVVDQVMTALDTAGLLENGTLRDAAVGKAILEHVDAVAKADLRRRAARLLHDDGAPATVVAQHLLAASVTEPWAGRTLLDAAYRSMEAGHEEMSLDCLRLAGQSACTERDRAAVLMARVKIGWQIDPRMVAPWLDALVDTLRAGHLKGADAAWTVKYLAWHGQFDEAGEALVALSEGPYAEDPRVEDELHVVRHWLRHTVPALDGGTVSGGPRRPPRRGLQPRQVSPSSYALELLGTVMAEGPDEHALAMAEEILRGCRSSTTGVEALEAALLTLVYGDRPDRALFWCDVLLQQAGSHVRGTVAAILAGIRAEVALHQGALPVAEQYARDALSAISHSGWGVAIGSPLSALVLAATASGKSGLAGAWLNHDVPVGMFETRHGLLYTHARGHYHLAVDRPAAALDDFLTCGELAKKWGADTPTFLPWRSSAAQAHLALGNPTQARALVREQLGRPGGSTPRARGVALRLMAASSELDQRSALLRESVNLLESCGSQIELIRALADRSRALHDLGAPAKARMVARHARTVADNCAADALFRRLFRDESCEGEGGSDCSQDEDEGSVSLTAAERRVTALAAVGHSNREIGRKLFITKSTVEQHLTRVYRKLGVRSRADLGDLFAGTNLAGTSGLANTS